MDSADDPLIGLVIDGRYRIDRPLGEGGMGKVYQATQEILRRKVAIKVLKPEYSVKEDIVARFHREAISASQIKHANVIEVFDYGMLENGCAYLAMEHLHGNDLAEELMQHGFIRTRRALRLALQVCKALHAAHRVGVVHRDMKPDNIFLVRSEDGEEQVKIVDFGIALLRTPDEEAQSQPQRRRLTKTGMIFGTPEYMAPEQAAGKKADERVDVYAMGIILFEMFTGAVPFSGDSFMAVLAAHLNDPVPSMMHYRPDLDLSQELHDVVAKALAKNPNERFSTMLEFAKAIATTPEGLALQAAGELNPVTLPPPAAGGDGASNSTRQQYANDGHAPAPPGYEAPAAAPGTQGPQVQAAAHAGLPQGSAEGPMAGRGRTAPKLEVQVTPEPSALPEAQRQGATQGYGSPSAGSPGRSPAVGVGTAAPVEGGVSSSGRGSGSLVLGVLLGVGAVAMGGWIVMNSDLVKSQAAAVSPSAPTAEASPSLPVTTAAASSAVAPSATQSAVAAEPVVEEPEDTRVLLNVETTPPGAVLELDGAQVCDTTPCEIKVEPGKAIKLSAKSGAYVGKVDVAPQKDQTVTIALRRPSKPKPRLCEKMVAGMKVLRPCN